MTVAIVPMKDLGQAKQRLSPVLSDHERIGLVHAMLADVLHALSGSSEIRQSYVVAHDRGYLDFGFDLIEEPENTGYNEAVALAVASKELSGASAVLILPGDMPLLTPAEIDGMATEIMRPGIRLAADRDGDGTNAILMSPPNLMATAFGPGSFARHQDRARQSASTVEVVDSDGLAFDIDTPDDLKALCAVDGTGETHRFLDLSGVRARLLANGT